MKKKKRALSALLAAFPSLTSFIQFKAVEENTKAIQSFAAFAYRNALIDKNDIRHLEEIIRQNTNIHQLDRSPENLDFETFLDQKKELFQLNLSTRALTDHINIFIDEHQLELPKVTNSMLSRLKKEAANTLHKKNVLRILAFWLGYFSSEQPFQWNYEILRGLCSKGKPSTDSYKEGVRIGFALFSRGEVIDYETVRWLKKEIKHHIDQSIKQLSYGRWGKIRSHDITTLYVDFPKETVNNIPEAYRKCLRYAISLCHQICIRWVLSKHHSPSRFLSIGVAAGDFNLLNNHLLPILNAKLPTDPVIRMTDYARQCVLINDIRVLSCANPSEITLYNGETLVIWWITGFWSTLYFDFIPDLLEDQILSNDPLAIKLLARSLWTFSYQDKNSDHSAPPNAISTFFKYPQNSLLGLEIAKTLYFQRRFWEAIEILRIALSLDPTNIIARTLRMMILCDLSLDSPNYSIAQGLFAKAHNEALFIEQNCAFQTEDFYCSYGIVYLAQAMLTLRYLREGRGTIEGESEVGNFKNKIFEYLKMADTLFGMGDMVSSTGVRSHYLQKCVKVLLAILESSLDVFSNPGSALDGSLETISKPNREFKWQLRYFKEAPVMYPPGKLKARIFRSDYLSHEASIALQAQRPSFYFCSAVAWWDFLPARTVGNTKIALQLLHRAKEIAEALRSKNICTYSFTRVYGEMMPADVFIEHMNRSIQMINTQAGSGLNKRSDAEIIEPKASNQMSLLMTLNF